MPTFLSWRFLQVASIPTLLLILGERLEVHGQSTQALNGAGCLPGCANCIEKSHCLECKPNHQRSGYKCFKNTSEKGCSDENCSDCSERVRESDQTVCYVCTEGFAVRDDTGLCKWTGPKGCDQQKCNSCPGRKDLCEGCVDGYHLRERQCVKATSNKGCNDKKCIECGADGAVCLRCTDDYQVRLGTCLQKGCLDENCIACSPSGGTCRRCKVGYRRDKKGRCVECPENCLECIVGKPQVVPRRPVNQPPPTPAATCERCAPGFFVTRRGECIGCDAVTPECNSCSSDANVCYGCNAGFWLEEGNCLACPENCESCKSPWKCDKASPKFKVDVLGVVVAEEKTTNSSMINAKPKLSILFTVIALIFLWASC
ncbi:hypothetical protein BSKO_09107 [Bryopsis sp. KO-2023]|nr:hypothetical protein BSKO_09107 [Bryopsis sp. KO-2023]